VAAQQLGVSVQWTRRPLRRFISDLRISVFLPDSGGVKVACLRSRLQEPRRAP
jgi:hypothetical protein